MSRRRTLAVIVLAAVGTVTGITLSSHHVRHETSGGIVVSTVGGQSVTTTALQQVCSIDVIEIQAAVAAYQQQFHQLPSAGTSWISALKVKGTSLEYWPTGIGFALTWNGTTLSVQPTRGTASHNSAGSPTLQTGCYGIR